MTTTIAGTPVGRAVNCAECDTFVRLVSPRTPAWRVFHCDACKADLTEKIDRIHSLIEREVVALNITLGYPLAYDFNNPSAPRVTFGYIGNDDDVLWSVFLPHPNRPGTHADRMGAHRPLDVHGAQAALTQVAAFRRGIEWAKAAPTA